MRNQIKKGERYRASLLIRPERFPVSCQDRLTGWMNEHNVVKPFYVPMHDVQDKGLRHLLIIEG